jgi:tryptophan-rich sensory protein
VAAAFLAVREAYLTLGRPRLVRRYAIAAALALVCYLAWYEFAGYLTGN